jgi:hypothetical protein
MPATRAQGKAWIAALFVHMADCGETGRETMRENVAACGLLAVEGCGYRPETYVNLLLSLWTITRSQATDISVNNAHPVDRMAIDRHESNQPPNKH